MTDKTRPDAATRATEAEDASVNAGADRAPTPEEEKAAEGLELDPEVAANYEAAIERGANTKGEGRVP